MKRVSPDIAPESIKANLCGCRLRPGHLKEAGRDLKPRVCRNDLDAGNPLGEVAAFTGRPPLLGGKYMSTPLPLDLSDEELRLPPAQLAVVASRLSDSGWGTDGVLKPSTMLRARAMMALVRDEILQVSLGHEKSVSADILL